MAKEKKEYSCGSGTEGMGCCKVESLVSVDERGQMVLPKELRERAKINAGDKLAVISWEKDGEVCCLFLIKADQFADMVKGMLGPLAKEILAK